MRERRAALEAAGGRDHAYRTLRDAALRGELGPGDEALGRFHEEFHDPERVAVFAAARDGGARIDAAGVAAASRLYTPDHLVAFLLQNSLGARFLEMHPASDAGAAWPFLVRGALGPPRPPTPLREWRVLDPCAGCGAFLLGAYDLLEGLHAEERALAARGLVPADWPVPPEAIGRTIVERTLHGMDVDGEALELCGLALARRSGPAARAGLRALELPLGALDGPLPGEGTFDVVCTNPPFAGFRRLDPALKAAVQAIDPLARIDLAVAFQSRMLGLAAPDGLVASVTPAAWTTSPEARPLRERVLAGGGPRLAAALGQRVFERAPLLFVSMQVIERGRRPERLVVLRVPSGAGPEGLRRAVRAGGEAVPREALERLESAPILPAAPALIARPRGPTVGERFAAADGVWTGSNARDVRFWWELPPQAPGWRPLAGGQGGERWHAPVRLRMRAAAAAGRPRRAGGLEYSRVAGGRLAARMVEGATPALAGLVTLTPREGCEPGRVEEALALFNSPAGTAWLRTLAGGLNFNPGAAGRVPLAPDPPAADLREAVRALVGLRRAEAERDPTADGFRDTVPPWADDGLAERIGALEDALDGMVADHLGVAARDLGPAEGLAPPRRRRAPLDDHLLVRALRLLGFRWPADGDGPLRPAGRGLSPATLAARLAGALEEEGAPAIDVRAWVGRRLLPYQATRFRRRPVLAAGPGGRIALAPRAGR